MIISSDYSMERDGNEASKENFRQKFKEQIKRLIKCEPRMIQKDDGNFAIYYS